MGGIFLGEYDDVFLMIGMLLMLYAPSEVGFDDANTVHLFLMTYFLRRFHGFSTLDGREDV